MGTLVGRGESRPDWVLHARFWGEAGMKCRYRYSGALERVRYWWGIFLGRRYWFGAGHGRQGGFG